MRQDRWRTTLAGFALTFGFVPSGARVAAQDPPAPVQTPADKPATPSTEKPVAPATTRQDAKKPQDEQKPDAPPVAKPQGETPVQTPPTPPVETPPVQTPPTQTPPAETPAAPKLADYTPKYRSAVELSALLKGWSAALPEVVHPLEFPALNPPLEALEIAKPGPIPPAERPTVFLVGGLDGVSIAGSEAVLSIVSDALHHTELLPNDVSFVALPWASPDALAMALSNDTGDGRSGRPLDDDHDGKVDEDGPDDLDGDGVLLNMLIEDPHGTWARSTDDRFLVPAGPADGVRYILCREGRDDDKDGRFNEDPPGGVVLDRNFPVGRTGSWNDELAGPLPLSEPISRAIADLILARRSVCVLFFQGNHGDVAAPGGFAPKQGESELIAVEDRPLFERVGETFQLATGRRQKSLVTLREARGAERRGAAVDWTYAVARALSVEVAVWGPLVESGGDVSAQDARFQQSGKPHAPGLSNGRAAPSESDRLWAAWFDNTGGGTAFSNWRPVGLDNGVQALVGGWMPHTIVNPPLESLPHALKGMSEFVRQIVAGMPRLQIQVTGATRDGEVCRIKARVKNTGLLPTGLAARGGARSMQGVELALDLPQGAQLLAGRAKLSRARLLGGESTDESVWVVLAPEGSTFNLRASSEWSVPSKLEVKP